MGELDGGAHQGHVAAVAGLAQAGDEAAVELELADGQASQVGQRGEAGAEVVDRDDQAEIVKPLDGVLAALEIGDRGRLGHLQDEGLRAEARSRRAGPPPGPGTLG